MGRNIVLLSDGTGNSAGKVWRTNVWRTFEALDLSGSDQVAFYDDGVGTSSFKPTAILGGAFGFGLRRNALELYKFACRNYRDDSDKLYGFGFSRGAFTIRIVMALIDNQGLVCADSEAELESLAAAAYRAYRKDRYKSLLLEAPYQFIRNKFGPAYPPPDVRRNVRIQFIGVWDTVSAYGMPIKEMNDGIHDYLWPIDLPDNKLGKSVVRACHALALDEERTTFHPQLWDETGENPKTATFPARRTIADERITQVWFAGVHSNVGGGYPDDSLAYIAFVWMLNEAKRSGLNFKSDHADLPPDVDVLRADPDTFRNALSRRDKDGRMYDPRQGLGGYYRYGPRKLVPVFYSKTIKMEEDEIPVGRAKIHESVFRRIANHAHAYAPVGLPPLYDIVLDNGEIVTADQFTIPPRAQPFETNAEASQRAEAQEHVWNEIWKRRIVYFASVAATLALLLFPLVSGAQRADEYESPIRWVSDLVRFIGNFLPDAFSTWIDGYARAPRTFVVLLFFVVLFLWWGARIAQRTAGIMTAIWWRTQHAPKGLPDDWIWKLRSNAWYIDFHEGLKKKFAPAFFAALFVYLGFGILSHITFDMLDVAGWTCVDHDRDPAVPPPLPLAVNETRVIDFSATDLCKPTGVMLASHGARYYVKVESDMRGYDGNMSFPLGGFSSKEEPRWYKRVLLTLALPFRRELAKDWFRIVLRYGRIGGEESILDPDPTDPLIQDNIKPTRSGELFVYINDVVVGFPGLYGWFYGNNRGDAQLTIRRTK
jgi:uncharacterized protein (DUF2235 family)